MMDSKFDLNSLIAWVTSASSKLSGKKRGTRIVRTVSMHKVQTNNILASSPFKLVIAKQELGDRFSSALHTCK